MGEAITCCAHVGEVTLPRGPTVKFSSETHPYISQQKSQLPYCIEKVLLKAVCRGTKKEPKTFMLRNINTVKVYSSDKLKC